MERFWSKVKKTETCWVWTAGTFKYRNGYGQFRVRRGDPPAYAHRFAWELVNGPIPQGLHVLHRCDNPPCVNPAHLFLGTQIDNYRDMVSKGRSRSISDKNRGKSHCKHGHLFTAENTYRQTGGGRGCKECHRVIRARYETKRKRAA